MNIIARKKMGDYVDRKVEEWLYGEYDEKKLSQFEFYHSLPLVGDYMDYLLDKRADQEYMQRYGIDYKDIHDPRKLRQTSSGSRLLGNSMRMVSRNVDSLYRDHNRKAARARQRNRPRYRTRR